MQAPLRLGDTVHLIGSNIIGKVYGIQSHADLQGRFWTNITVEDSLGHRTTFSGLFSDNLIKHEKGK